jgi:predicted negative regulator of RcsB-dependent stress response
MGWEQRGNNSYYYKKERDGSRVKSVYVGRGEIAHMISQFQSSSAEVEKLLRVKKSIEADELENAEAALDRAIELTQLFTEAELLVAGFHTHHRQWRRKRNVA